MAKPVPTAKPENRRVDEEADAMRANQHDDDERLAEFLDHRADVAAVAGEIDAGDAQCVRVHEIAGDGHDEARARRR